MLLFGFLAGELNLGILFDLDMIQSKLVLVQSMDNLVHLVKGIKGEERDLVRSAVLFQIPKKRCDRK